MKSSKRHLTDGMELPNQEKIRPLDEPDMQDTAGEAGTNS